MKHRRTLKIGKLTIGKCHPRSTRKNRCLPNTVYKISTCKSTEYCPKGDHPCGDHEIINSLNISKTEKQRLRSYLRPKIPKTWKDKPNTWLDNFNIEDVMKQYEEMCPWFVFLGVFPIDFSISNPYNHSNDPKCLYPETCNIKLKEYYEKGTRSIGVIFNLDTHDKSGSHWVAMYIDFHSINRPMSMYFDSYGYKAPNDIALLMKYFKIENPRIKLMYNARRFQYGHSECGMFSLFFIISMISRIPFKKFCKMKIDDKKMLELRKFLFSE